MVVDFDRERVLGVNMRSGKTVPARGVFISKDTWAKLEEPIKLEEPHISRSSFELEDLREEQIVAISVNGDLRTCLYLVGSIDKLGGKEYVFHPSHKQANRVNVEFVNDRNWDTTTTIGSNTIDQEDLELYMVSDEYLLEDVRFSTKFVSSNI